MYDIGDDFTEAHTNYLMSKNSLRQIREQRAVADNEDLRLAEAKQWAVTKAAYTRMQKLDALHKTCCAIQASLPQLQDPEYQALSAMIGKPRYRVH